MGKQEVSYEEASSFWVLSIADRRISIKTSGETASNLTGSKGSTSINYSHISAVYWTTSDHVTFLEELHLEEELKILVPLKINPAFSCTFEERRITSFSFEYVCQKPCANKKIQISFQLFVAEVTGVHDLRFSYATVCCS